MMSAHALMTEPEGMLMSVAASLVILKAFFDVNSGW